MTRKMASKRIVVTYLISLFILSSSVAFGQGQQIANDGKTIMTEQDFIKLVLAYHPLAKQADLITERGKQVLRASRGNFDPELFSYWDQKDFNDTYYYNYFSGGLKVPTWYGVEFKAGWDYSDPDARYFSSDKRTPSEGLGYIGISVPIGQDLLMDKRRAALRQAKIFQEATEMDRILMLNDLLLDALYDYWDWAKNYNNVIVYRNSIDAARDRFRAIMQNYLAGESSAMDTLEARTQIQAIELNYLEAEVQFKNKGLMLSNHLWSPEGLPVELQANMRPVSLDEVEYNSVESIVNLASDLDNTIQNHPLMQSYQFKIQQLEIEKAYKASRFLPKLRFNYNLLTTGVDNFNYSPNNYKVGLTFSYPILLRSERGEYQLTKIKIEETNLQISQKQLELRNKLEAYINQLLTLQNQLSVFTDATSNYSTLLRFEEIMLFNGESTLFRVNARELSYYQAQIKLNELRAKFFQTRAGAAYTTGQLNLYNY